MERCVERGSSPIAQSGRGSILRQRRQTMWWWWCPSWLSSKRLIRSPRSWLKIKWASSKAANIRYKLTRSIFKDAKPLRISSTLKGRDARLKSLRTASRFLDLRNPWAPRTFKKSSGGEGWWVEHEGSVCRFCLVSFALVLPLDFRFITWPLNLSPPLNANDLH